MTASPTNYFVCTLGQASLLNSTKPNQRIPAFIEEQSQRFPNSPAVGFYLPSRSVNNERWDYRIITFRQLQYGSSAVVETVKLLISDIESSHTIAILAPSSAEFLFLWLALIQLNRPALLITPQCAPKGIGELCKQCDVSILLCDRRYEDLAFEASKEAKNLGFRLETMSMPVRNETQALDYFEEAPEPSLYPSKSVQDAKLGAETDVAYLHHTSGTSTGIPKPIPQTHRGGLGVLPRLDGSSTATFTTTPLYHGGIADVLRAWTSNALIWLFPAKDRPITATNVVKCLDIAAQASEDSSSHNPIPPVKYFSSVPYVLQMIHEDPAALKHLQRMHIVGVGGAALPEFVGDGLVEKGVNLVSTFGSVECGFLMSSHRDYETDKEWQYLRLGEGVQHLHFEPREGGPHELLVENGWPYMPKPSREDRSYATADLFVPHLSIPNAWRYHSRADNQLTLVTGTKFDPEPMEAALVASSSAIADVLIFGNGRSHPGALVFRSRDAAGKSDADVKEEVRAALKKINKESQSHARIGMEMLIVMPVEEQALEKDSKGTVQRRKAEERYKDAIEKAYAASIPESCEEVSDEELPTAVLEIANTILHSIHPSSRVLTPETDLFATGVDSIVAVQIRQSLGRFLPNDATPLPLSIVQDTGTAANLSKRLLSLRQGKSKMLSNDPLSIMRELANKYSDFSHIVLPSFSTDMTNEAAKETVLLTGSTGFLGAHVLSLLLSSPGVSHVYLLVRGASMQAAIEDVCKALTSRQLPVPSNFGERVTVLPYRLHDSDLGLNPSDLDRLRRKVTCMIHLAWDNNYLLSLSQFEKVHFAGLRDLLALAASSTCPTAPKFIFSSSISSVSSHPIPIPESIISDPAISGPTGYARSKHVAEQICSAFSSHPRLKDRITIMRVGQLSGNSQTGVWNAFEAYPLMLSTAKKEILGCLPDLDKARRAQGERAEELNWLPVDSAAQAFIEVALGHHQYQQVTAPASKDLIDFSSPSPSHLSTLHLLPPTPRTHQNLEQSPRRPQNGRGRQHHLHRRLPLQTLLAPRHQRPRLPPPLAQTH